MINHSKLALVAVLATISAASSAYAQSIDRLGSPLPYYYDLSGAQSRGSWSAPAVTPYKGAPVAGFTTGGAVCSPICGHDNEETDR